MLVDLRVDGIRQMDNQAVCCPQSTQPVTLVGKQNNSWLGGNNPGNDQHLSIGSPIRKRGWRMERNTRNVFLRNLRSSWHDPIPDTPTNPCTLIQLSADKHRDDVALLFLAMIIRTRSSIACRSVCDLVIDMGVKKGTPCANHPHLSRTGSPSLPLRDWAISAQHNVMYMSWRFLQIREVEQNRIVLDVLLRFSRS